MKILMLCLGNICRSPMAEGILRAVALKSNMNMEVASAGTASYHAGEKADARAILCMRNHGIDISAHRAKMFAISDFEYFDFIYCMDKNNLKDALLLARNENDKGKLKMLLHLNRIESGLNVPDPYYGDLQGFEEVFTLCEKACRNLISHNEFDAKK